MNIKPCPQCKKMMIAEEFSFCPRCGFSFGAAKSVGEPATGSEPTKEEKATDELHEAARHFVSEWIKAPRDSSFDVWFKACERLERAAVEYANAKATAER